MENKPSIGEIVICKITKINPHSAFAIIEEYNIEGLIHISEVASGWVKDISQHLKEGHTIVAKVVNVDTNIINLSVKRVDRNSRESKLREYKKEKKAEKMLDMAAKKIKQAGKAEDVKKAIKEKLGSLSAAFELGERAEELLKDAVSEKWLETIREIAEKSAHDREFEFSANLKLASYEPDGIKKIVSVLKKCEEEGFAVSYISAPDYLLRFSSKEAKKGDHEFGKKLDEIADFAKKAGCFKEIKAIK
jgi:translation initiation factor 2 subunit 1